MLTYAGLLSRTEPSTLAIDFPFDSQSSLVKRVDTSLSELDGAVALVVLCEHLPPRSADYLPFLDPSHTLHRLPFDV